MVRAIPPVPQGSQSGAGFEPFAAACGAAGSRSAIDDLHLLRLACQVADYEVAAPSGAAATSDAATSERESGSPLPKS